MASQAESLFVIVFVFFIAGAKCILCALERLVAAGLVALELLLLFL
jgi:hypothetical protein